MFSTVLTLDFNLKVSLKVLTLDFNLTLEFNLKVSFESLIWKAQTFWRSESLKTLQFLLLTVKLTLQFVVGRRALPVVFSLFSSVLSFCLLAFWKSDNASVFFIDRRTSCWLFSFGVGRAVPVFFSFCWAPLLSSCRIRKVIKTIINPTALSLTLEPTLHRRALPLCVSLFSYVLES